MRKRVMKRAGIGFLMGIAIGNLIAVLSGRLVSQALIERMSGEAGAIALQTLLSGLYGAATMAGTLLYDIDRWPLALATAVHCAVCLVPYVPIALTLGWVETAGQLFISLGIQVAVFFLIWLVMYLLYRKQVRELNEIQKKKAEGK